MAIASKRVRLSSDGGSTYNTLPGNSASMSNESGQLNDTVFGKNFESNHPGLINWSVNSNAIFKGFAGYLATIKKVGTATAFTTEACTLVSGKTYQINNTAKRIWDRTGTFTVFDTAVAVAASNILSFDYLFGRVTFVAGYTVGGAVTVTGVNFPTVAVAGSQSFTLTQTANALDKTDMPTAQANSGHRIFDYGLQTVRLELSAVYANSSTFRADLVARTEFIVELNPDGSSESIARGFFRYTNQGQSGDVGALEEETITMTLNVPDDPLLEIPFKWEHTGAASINTAVKDALTAFENGTLVKMRYLPDGVVGVEGDAVVTEVSLAGGLEAMNVFSINLQGTAALTSV